jgi:hypothetical protein
MLLLGSMLTFQLLCVIVIWKLILEYRIDRANKQCEKANKENRPYYKSIWTPTGNLFFINCPDSRENS